MGLGVRSFVKFDPTVRSIPLPAGVYNSLDGGATLIEIAGDFSAALEGDFGRDIFQNMSVTTGAGQFGVNEVITTVGAITLLNGDNPIDDNSDPDGDYGVFATALPFSNEADSWDFTGNIADIAARLGQERTDQYLLSSGRGNDLITLPTASVAALLNYSLQHYFDAGEGNDTIRGAAGAVDDFVAGREGNDLIELGKGRDTALFTGSAADYLIAYKGNPTKVTSDSTLFEVVGPDGTDLLRDVEVVRLEGGPSAPLVKWHIVASRGQDGTIKSVKFYENGKELWDAATVSGGKASAYDDATPLAAGTYQVALRTNGTHGPGDKVGNVLEFLDIAGRTDVQMHIGNFTYNSEGCLVVPGAFLKSVTDHISKEIKLTGMPEVRPNYFETPVPITIEYKDVAGKVKQPKLAFSDDTMKVSDAKALDKDITIALSDAGKNGITKWVKLTVEADRSAGLNNKDFGLGGKGGTVVKQNGDKYVIWLKPGETAANLNLHVNANRGDEAKEVLTLRLVDVDLFNEKADGKRVGYDENDSETLHNLLFGKTTSMAIKIAADKAPKAAMFHDDWHTTYHDLIV